MDTETLTGIAASALTAASLIPQMVKVLREKNGSSVSYGITGGFVEVLNNKASVLVEGATEL